MGMSVIALVGFTDSGWAVAYCVWAAIYRNRAIKNPDWETPLTVMGTSLFVLGPSTIAIRNWTECDGAVTIYA